jgi:hypothetical protein
MRAFRISHTDDNQEVYATRYTGTLGDAKKVAHEVPKALRDVVFVDEVPVHSDKAGMLAALNGKPIVGEPIASYSISARGALVKEL